MVLLACVRLGEWRRRTTSVGCADRLGAELAFGCVRLRVRGGGLKRLQEGVHVDVFVALFALYLFPFPTRPQNTKSMIIRTIAVDPFSQE